MWPVVIVLLEIPADVFPRLRQAAILRSPDFLFLQATMEPFDVAVALGMMIGRPAVCDAELRKRLHQPARGKVWSVVSGQSEIHFSTPRWHPLQHCLFNSSQR